MIQQFQELIVELENQRKSTEDEQCRRLLHDAEMNVLNALCDYIMSKDEPSDEEIAIQHALFNQCIPEEEWEELN